MGRLAELKAYSHNILTSVYLQGTRAYARAKRALEEIHTLTLVSCLPVSTERYSFDKKYFVLSVFAFIISSNLDPL